MDNTDKREVYLSSCDTYDVDLIESTIRKQMEESGVIEYIKPGMKVALKLNLVAAMKPNTAVTTHPAIVEAVCRILINKGAEVVMGDSPGGPFTSAFLKPFNTVCGLNGIAERTGAKINNNFDIVDVSNKDAIIAKNMTVTKWLEDADVIINCCKLKTHGMMAMSAAVKNMFGSIPGTMKPEYHFRFPNQADFADMLIDIQEYWKPKMLYHIVDGIVGMEGNGPTAGTPKEVGVILSGFNPYSIDLVGGRIIGLSKEQVLTLERAFDRGLAAGDVRDVSVSINGNMSNGTAEALAPFLISDYELLDTKSDLQFGGDKPLQRLRGKLFSVFLTSKPQVNKKECVGCEKCYQICPAKAIEMKDKIPCIDRDKCIKCFCCQEFCPKGAMKVHRSWVAKLLSH